MLCASLFPAIIGSTFPGAVYMMQDLKFRSPGLVHTSPPSIHAQLSNVCSELMIICITQQWCVAIRLRLYFTVALQMTATPEAYGTASHWCLQTDLHMLQVGEMLLARVTVTAKSGSRIRFRTECLGPKDDVIITGSAMALMPRKEQGSST